MKFNRKGVTLIDVVLAMSILTLLTLIYYGGLKSYYKYTTRAENAVYTNFALTECAEVIHSIRYGEWDRSGSIGWGNFRNNYPTGLYRLSYNDTTSVWEVLPIYKDIVLGEHFISFREMLSDTGYTTNTIGENYNVGPKRIQLRRYVFINNNITDKSIITCYVKYYDPHFKKEFKEDANDFFNYEELKFIMTNYM